MMKRIERGIYVVVIIGITTLGLIGNKRLRTALEQQDNMHTTMITELNDLTLLEEESEDYQIDSPKILINELGDSVFLRKLVNIPKLVLYFSPNSCSICLDSLFIQFESCLNKYSKRLLIITSEAGYRDLLIQLANSKNHYSYSLLSDKPGIFV